MPTASFLRGLARLWIKDNSRLFGGWIKDMKNRGA